VKYLVSVFIVLAFMYNASAAIKVKGDVQPKSADENAEYIDEDAAIATLEEEIRILDEKINQCKKQKKGWIAATVVGSAGVVATGVTAGVQALQIKDKKQTLDDKKQELKDITAKTDALK